MKIIRFQNAAYYYQKVKSYLIQQEATHCLLLGIAKSLSGSAEQNDCDLSYLAVVEDNQNILVTAIRTPRRKLIISRAIAVEAVELIARDLAIRSQLIPGVIASQSEAQTFINAWQDLTEQSYELDVAMRLHQLEKVQPITSAAGKSRSAVESDRNLLTKWGQAFEREALGNNEPKSDHQLWFNQHLENKSLFIWQDNKNVALHPCGMIQRGIVSK